MTGEDVLSNREGRQPGTERTHAGQERRSGVLAVVKTRCVVDLMLEA